MVIGLIRNGPMAPAFSNTIHSLSAATAVVHVRARAATPAPQGRDAVRHAMGDSRFTVCAEALSALLSITAVGGDREQCLPIFVKNLGLARLRRHRLTALIVASGLRWVVLFPHPSWVLKRIFTTPSRTHIYI